MAVYNSFYKDLTFSFSYLFYYLYFVFICFSYCLNYYYVYFNIVDLANSYDFVNLYCYLYFSNYFYNLFNYTLCLAIYYYFFFIYSNDLYDFCFIINVYSSNCTNMTLCSPLLLSNYLDISIKELFIFVNSYFSSTNTYFYFSFSNKLKFLCSKFTNYNR